jgi:hypothetical protein
MIEGNLADVIGIRLASRSLFAFRIAQSGESLAHFVDAWLEIGVSVLP